MLIHFKTNEMQKPTKEEIGKAIIDIANKNPETPNSFTIGFNLGVEWLLNWQKTQQLQTRCHCGEIEIESHTCPYKVDIKDDTKTLCNCCDFCKHVCSEEI